jgi:hypothetical protein
MQDMKTRVSETPRKPIVADDRMLLIKVAPRMKVSSTWIATR